MSAEGGSPTADAVAAGETRVHSLSGNEPGGLVEVAVPIPLPGPLTYSAPAGLLPFISAGARAVVRVGPRRLVGFVVGQTESAPEGVRIRSLERLLDRRSLFLPETLELAHFVADYYLTPLGEVLRSMLPSELEAWGNRRAALTDAGAFASCRDSEETRLVEWLRDQGPRCLSDLQQEFGPRDVMPVVESLESRGALRLSRRGKGTRRFHKGFALRAESLEALLERAGRSEPGRRVVGFLADLGRPASRQEILSACECGAGVVRRLTGLGVVQEFEQSRSQSLGSHISSAVSSVPEFVLSADQQTAVDAMCGALEAGGYVAQFLQGMTGAGKTEVYLRAAARALALDRGVIVMVPEIALVPVLAGELRTRFGGRVAILHSALSPTERQQEWLRIASGEARVVLGPRSAVFAPVERLGLIVVDEEQDSSYKQEISPRYNARDLALVRARRVGGVAVLVSATPSFETRLNVETGKIAPLVLTSRVGGASLPESILVDLRDEKVGRQPGEVHFSERLVSEVETSLGAGEQIILLRNRRGYAPMMLCRACGEDLRCEACGLPRTFHRRIDRLLCHYCGSSLETPVTCPTCSEAALEAIGAGTERVEERFCELFPGTVVDVLDRDTVKHRGSVSAVLDRFGRGDSQVLIGTQMVSKGHHFPRVALAGVLSADTYLGFPDFRAVEKTYSLLTQLAGRAGRGALPGRVVLQTFYPDHYAIQAFLAQDDSGFAEREMRFRRTFLYPPFSRMVQILARDTKRERAAETLRAIADAVYKHPLAREIRVAGPAPAPLERLRNKWRYQLILRSTSGGRVRQVAADAAAVATKSEVIVDVDPYQLL